MGIICPECRLYQPQVSVTDSDGNPPRTEADVFLIKLACGHVVGADKARAWVAATSKVKAAWREKRDQLDKDYQAELASIWDQFTKGGTETGGGGS